MSHDQPCWSTCALLPLAICDDQGHFVSSAIRDPETEEIVDKALSSQQLAEKAGIDLEQARRIFQAARDVAALRLVEIEEWGADRRESQRVRGQKAEDQISVAKHCVDQRSNFDGRLLVDWRSGLGIMTLR